jgi:hypothetical protein
MSELERQARKLDQKSTVYHRAEVVDSIPNPRAWI